MGWKEVRIVAPPGTSFGINTDSDGKLIIVLRKWDGSWPIEVDARTIQTIEQGSNTFMVTRGQ